MAQVFISYSRADRDIAGQIAEAVQAEGLSVWWDHDISTGERWDKVIKRELDVASAVLVLWSPSSVERDQTVKSEWVANEASEGKRREILAPVLVKGGAPPFEFQRVQAQDLNAWRGDRHDPAWRTLVQRLHVLCGLAAPPSVQSSPTHVEPAWTTPTSQPNGVSVLRIRRESRMNAMLVGMAVRLNGEKLGEIGNGASADFTIPAGHHTLQLQLQTVKSDPMVVSSSPGGLVKLVAAMPKTTDMSALLGGKISLEPDAA